MRLRQIWGGLYGYFDLTRVNIGGKSRPVKQKFAFFRLNFAIPLLFSPFWQSPVLQDALRRAISIVMVVSPHRFMLATTHGSILTNGKI